MSMLLCCIQYIVCTPVTFPNKRPVIMQSENIDLCLKISINGHRLVVRLGEAIEVVTTVVQRYAIYYHTHLE